MKRSELKQIIREVIEESKVEYDVSEYAEYINEIADQIDNLSGNKSDKELKVILKDTLKSEYGFDNNVIKFIINKAWEKTH